MSYEKGLSEVAVTQFDTDFLAAYQAENSKMDGIFESRNVVGDSYVWKRLDQFKLGPRGAYHTPVPQTIPEYQKITMYPNNDFQILSLPSDIFEQTEVNASESMALAKGATKALNRAKDQIRYNGLLADKASYEEIAATSNFSVDTLRKLMAYFDDENVPDDERYFFGTPSQKSSILNQEKATSSDYATVKALVNGQINSFMGFKFIWIGKMIEGGIAKNGSIRDCFAVSKTALGEGLWLSPSVRVAWDEHIESWVVKPKLKMGAKVVDTTGVIYVPCTES